MAAYRNIPACCRGKSPPADPSTGMQPLASTPACCKGAPPFDPSPSPIVESPYFVSADDYYSQLGDSSSATFYTAGQDTPLWSESDISPHTDLYSEQEEHTFGDTEGSSEYYSDGSGRCPGVQMQAVPAHVRSPPPTPDDTDVSAPSYSDVSGRCPGATQETAHAPPTPAEWNTPKVQRRSDHIRRFNCKRRLTFHDVQEWVMSGTEELDADGQAVHDARGEPPPAVMLEYQSRELATKPDDGCMETVYGPLPQHKYVPLWVYMARDQYPEVFQEALTYYFENTGWPELAEMDDSFQQDCEEVGISAVAFKKTVGFAPVWIFILDIISRANMVERRWFDSCMDEFFEFGFFPEVSSMPDQLQQACQKMDVSDYDFYVPDM